MKYAVGLVAAIAVTAICLVTLTRSHAQAVPVHWVGQQAGIYGEWVKVMNPRGITYFSFGDMCAALGGNIKVLAVEGDDLLVRYRSLDGLGGSECPSRTLFFVSKDKFQTLDPPSPTPATAAAQDAQDQAWKSRLNKPEKAHIEHLLGGK